MAMTDLLRDGDLSLVLAELQQQVRKQPGESKHRIFLFQLNCILGDWQKALNQLNVLRELDALTLPMVQTYQEAIQCEALRQRVFAGERMPLLLGEPEPWLALMLEALKLTARGDHEQAECLRARALEDAPATAGQCNGRPFSWLMDSDPRLGPVVEAIVNGRYYWIPLHRIRSIQVDEPEDLRDLVWMPAHFTWANGGETVGLIPARYPGSESSEDQLIRLARKTAWLEPVPGVYLGQGQRILTSDSDEFPLLDVRRIDLKTSADTATGDGESADA